MLLYLHSPFTLNPLTDSTFALFSGEEPCWFLLFWGNGRVPTMLMTLQGFLMREYFNAKYHQ